MSNLLRCRRYSEQVVYVKTPVVLILYTLHLRHANAPERGLYQNLHFDTTPLYFYRIFLTKDTAN